MEGSYNKVLLAKGSVPAESYKYFIDILMATVRGEIASCLEKAYRDIGCRDAARMLSIDAGAATPRGFTSPLEKRWILSRASFKVQC